MIADTTFRDVPFAMSNQDLTVTLGGMTVGARRLVAAWSKVSPRHGAAPLPLDVPNRGLLPPVEKRGALPIEGGAMI